jgi:hypothetical protein
MKPHLILFIIVFLISCKSESKKTPTLEILENIKEIPIKAKSPKEVTEIWSKAINQRDWNALNSIYDNTVSYYTETKQKKECLENKIKAIEKHEYFSQKISDIEIVKAYNNTYEVYFQKEYTSSKSKKDTTLGFLMLSNKNGSWKITLESDIESSRKHKDKICTCSDFWASLYNGGKTGYYLLSGSWGNETVYIGKDGFMFLHIEYHDLEKEKTITFVTRENLELTAPRFSTEKFDLKNLSMTQVSLGYNSEEKIRYNKRFYKKLNQYCK